MLDREFSFYFMVPGLSIYGWLVFLLYYLLIGPLLSHTLNSEKIVLYCFLVLIFYPISIVLVHIGNKKMQLFSTTKAVLLGLIPIITTVTIVALLMI